MHLLVSLEFRALQEQMMNYNISFRNAIPSQHFNKVKHFNKVEMLADFIKNVVSVIKTIDCSLNNFAFLWAGGTHDK